MSGSQIFFPRKKFVKTTYTTSGSFNVPEGVEQVFILACGGGAGGHGCNNGQAAGGGGGAIFNGMVNTVPGESLSISVGLGGNGGTGVSIDAVAGGLTQIQGTNFNIICPGGSVGLNNSTPASRTGGKGAALSSNANFTNDGGDPTILEQGYSSQYASGGTTGAGPSGTGGGGGLGTGGNGARAASSATSGGIGAGGGGGVNIGGRQSGGNGGNGIVYISYYKSI